MLQMGDEHAGKSNGPKTDPCGKPCSMETVKKV